MKTADKAAMVVAEFLNGNDAAANTITRRLSDAGLLAPDTDHPTALETVEDYTNAPEWTIICAPSGAPLLKDQLGTWRAAGISTPIKSESLALGAKEPATVLRWGGARR